MVTELKDVAVLVLNYNSADLTIECVRNLINLSDKIRILIIDNCSSDESVLKINEVYRDKTQIKMLRNPCNCGYAAGNNYGLQFVRKQWSDVKYVMIINPDIVINEANTIYRMRSVLEDNESYSIVSCQIIFNSSWRGFRDFGWKFPEKKHLMWAGTFWGKFFLQNINNAYSEIYADENIAEVDVVPGCFFMAKINDMQKVSDFDDRTFLYFEETILANKLRRINKKEVILLNEFVRHNHEIKDKNLVDYKKRLFDRKCFHDSKMIYIRCYSKLYGVRLLICTFVNELDFLIKRVVYSVLSYGQKRRY